jgi:hypothetical protein
VEQRTTFDADMEPVPLAEDCTTESLDFSGVPAEKIVHPGAIQGKVLLYLHGGGYVVGSLKSYRHLVLRFAVAALVTANWTIGCRPNIATPLRLRTRRRPTGSFSHPASRRKTLSSAAIPPVATSRKLFS